MRSAEIPKWNDVEKTGKEREKERDKERDKESENGEKNREKGGEKRRREKKESKSKKKRAIRDKVRVNIVLSERTPIFWIRWNNSFSLVVLNNFLYLLKTSYREIFCRKIPLKGINLSEDTNKGKIQRKDGKESKRECN